MIESHVSKRLLGERNEYDGLVIFLLKRKEGCHEFFIIFQCRLFYFLVKVYYHFYWRDLYMYIDFFVLKIGWRHHQ